MPAQISGSEDAQARVRQQFIQRWKAWQQFWSTPLGEALQSAQRRSLSPTLGAVFGHHLLYLGTSEHSALIDGGDIDHRMGWSPIWQPDLPDATVVAEPEWLPLPDESLDLVVMHHWLELQMSPHLALREAARLTMPRGQLVIMGMNPLSLWGAQGWWGRHRGGSPRHQGPRLSVRRLQDWLSFLDMRVERVEWVFHRPPVQMPRLLSATQGIDYALDRLRCPFAASYMIWARKRVGSPIYNGRRLRQWVTSTGLVQPMPQGRHAVNRTESSSKSAHVGTMPSSVRDSDTSY